jgi:hypothetical protein
MLETRVSAGSGAQAADSIMKPIKHRVAAPIGVRSSSITALIRSIARKVPPNHIASFMATCQSSPPAPIGRVRRLTSDRKM